MNVVLLRVGIDSGSGGAQGPLLQNGTFELIPIPDTTNTDTRTYGNTLGRHGRPLAEYLPARLQTSLRHAAMHVDPEFETFTYGDPTPPKARLRDLKQGDVLAFYCGLEGFDFPSPPALYLIGYFVVSAAGRAEDFSEFELSELFGANFHVRHRTVLSRQRSRLVLVKGGAGSRLLNYAYPISQVAQDRAGRAIKVLSREAQQVFGDFDGHVSIQRSPPRWVASSHIAGACRFLDALS